MESVGAYEAKTHLPQFLDRVARGEEIQITRNGRPVARLVPEPAEEITDIRSVIAQIREFRKGRKLGSITIRELDRGRTALLMAKAKGRPASPKSDSCSTIPSSWPGASRMKATNTPTPCSTGSPPRAPWYLPSGR